MKKSFLFLILTGLFMGVIPLKAQNLSPYIKVGKIDKSVSQTASLVNSALQAGGFEVLGSYHPEGKSGLMVIAFSRSDLQQTVLKVKERGALAAVLKVGLKQEGAGTVVSYVNPEYMFNAYLRKSYPAHKQALQKVSTDVKKTLSGLGSDFTPFGGSLPVSKLRKYQYKMMMPYFDDPVSLKKFNSFEEGVKTIERNLASGKGHTKAVYTLIFKSEQVAVFGVGLHDQETGEAHFLPIIGEDHLAALPYEIILQGKEATILHGRFRIALFWPELTMGTFMKIMSTPGDIEDTLEALCK